MENQQTWGLELRTLFPLQHSKTPRTPNLSKICPDDCFSGFQSGDPKLSKICPEIVVFWFFNKFLTNLGPSDWNPTKKKTSGQILDKFGVRGVFECCKGTKGFASLEVGKTILRPPNSCSMSSKPTWSLVHPPAFSRSFHKACFSYWSLQKKARIFVFFVCLFCLFVCLFLLIGGVSWRKKGTYCFACLLAWLIDRLVIVLAAQYLSSASLLATIYVMTSRYQWYRVEMCPRRTLGNW